MAIKLGPFGYYVGLSSDSKPSPGRQGILFYETDTGAWYIWNSSAWTAYTYQITNVRP